MQGKNFAAVPDHGADDRSLGSHDFLPVRLDHANGSGLVAACADRSDHGIGSGLEDNPQQAAFVFHATVCSAALAVSAAVSVDVIGGSGSGFYFGIRGHPCIERRHGCW